MDKMLLIDKPAGMTSFGVVARVRRVLSEQAGKKVKVGHTGTLDPFATGLLILMTGKMTKRCQDFLKLDKEYIATLRLGQISTTGDPEGEITDYINTGAEGRIGVSGGCAQAAAEPKRLAPVKTGGENAPARNSNRPSASNINKVLQSFLGEIEQTPPIFSAIKVNGKRAYDLARKGEPVSLKPRKVKIYELETLSYAYPELTLRCKVSSGTYIRTLAEDIGKSLGTGAYLTALRRTKIADYRVEDALPLSALGLTD